ncbi:MAG: SPOR domain-containing protein [Gemmatimonadales bacterium]
MAILDYAYRTPAFPRESEEKDTSNSFKYLKVHRSRKSLLLTALVWVWVTPFVASCGDGQESASMGGALDRAAWLGSAEGWGLLGLPLGGGPLSYLSAANLESPTWAPPELGRVVRAWPGDGVIWVQFADTRIGLYDYSTGHILSFDSLKVRAPVAVPLDGETAVAVVRDSSSVELAGVVSEGWRVRFDGQLTDLKDAGGGRLVAVVSGGTQNELVVFEPPVAEPVAQRSGLRVRDLVVTPSGEMLYYTSADEGDLAIHGLGLPELDELDTYVLPEPADAIALTPSGHRLYAAAGSSLHAFDRLRDEPVSTLPLPGRATALRFSVNGSNLLARLAGGEEIAVVRVGVDSVLGVLRGGWDDRLPVSLPGGRLIAQTDSSLVLYDILRLVEVARAESGEGLAWLAVNWQPPRPRADLASRPGREAGPVTGSPSPSGGDAGLAPEEGVPAGFYAVVLAARQRAGVDELVSWLRSVGYSSVVDLHRDVMGVEWFRAMVGPYASREQAEAAAQSLAARYGYKPWILRVEPEEQPTETGADVAGEGNSVADAPLENGGT